VPHLLAEHQRDQQSRAEPLRQRSAARKQCAT